MEDTNNVESLIDHHRWLMNNGVMHDSIKNQLFMYGSIVHRNVVAVDLAVDVAAKLVSYKIFVDVAVKGKVDKFFKLKESTSTFGLWKFKRFLKKEGNLDFHAILNSFVKDYCGRGWNATVETIDFNDYVEDYDEDSDIDKDTELNTSTDG